MQAVFCLTLFSILSVVLQFGVVPAVAPPLIRPDFCLIFALAALVMGPREFGLVCVFLLGFVADMFGSSRFGLLTLSYLLAAGTVMGITGKDMVRGDTLMGALLAIAGTLLAHGAYVLIGRTIGLDLPWTRAGAQLLGLAIGGALVAMPIMYITGKLFFRIGMMDGAERETWLVRERASAAQRRRAARAGGR